MNITLRRGLLALIVTAVTAFAAACGNSDTQSSGTSGMSGMDHSQTTGQSSTGQANAIDRAFVTQMIPHHQMAVQMAKSAQKMGTHRQITHTADAIVSAQEQEITQLQAIAEELGVKPASMPTSGMSTHGDAVMADAKALGLTMDQMGMSMNMDGLMSAKPFDRAFIDDMIPHHQGAIRMARAELADGSNAKLKKIATAIVAAQAKEIRQMNTWRTDWYGNASPAGGVPSA